MVTSVKIKNRHDCCGDRIEGTQVTISGKKCGEPLPKLANGASYTVNCNVPGTEVRLTTTKNNYLQINSVEVFGMQAMRSSGGSMRIGTAAPTAHARQAKTIRMGGSANKMGGGGGFGYTIPPNTKIEVIEKSATQSGNYAGGRYAATGAF